MVEKEEEVVGVVVCVSLSGHRYSFYTFEYRHPLHGGGRWRRERLRRQITPGETLSYQVFSSSITTANEKKKKRKKKADSDQVKLPAAGIIHGERRGEIFCTKENEQAPPGELKRVEKSFSTVGVPG